METEAAAASTASPPRSGRRQPRAITGAERRPDGDQVEAMVGEVIADTRTMRHQLSSTFGHLTASMLKMGEGKAPDPMDDDAKLALSFVERAKMERRKDWSTSRRFVAAILENQKFDFIMAMVILFNIAVMILEANDNAACQTRHEVCSGGVLALINYVLLAIYTVEISMRLFVHRRETFYERWNMLDLFIVIIGLVDVAMTFGGSVESASEMPNMSLLRIFRVLRLIRAVRVMTMFPQLFSIIQGFASSMSAMGWGFFMIMVLNLIMSILAVELIHDKNLTLAERGIFEDDSWCVESFSSVQNAILLFFQTVVAGDSWGTCAVPLVQNYQYLFAFFAFAYLTVQLGFTNLILSVVIEAATAARDADIERLVMEKRVAEQERAMQLHRIFDSIDADGNGRITLEEFLAGYEELPDFQNILTMLSMDKDDLTDLFSYMDPHMTDRVPYADFVKTIRRSQDADIRVQLMMVRMQLAQMSMKTARDIESMKVAIEDLSDTQLCIAEDVRMLVAAASGEASAEGDGAPARVSLNLGNEASLAPISAFTSEQSVSRHETEVGRSQSLVDKRRKREVQAKSFEKHLQAELDAIKDSSSTSAVLNEAMLLVHRAAIKARAKQGNGNGNNDLETTI